ncbi:putative membrane protein [Verrucomicrobium sp. GAS474]|uniref:DUF420 domain-containing protein n=1 Tax=Verrucomicrobium sp. GAS474 TaxID=1882831 RepID=UPI0008799948|nr:DUF420 domain-containing protein [Verrucomicrobium sp. GAS474]SDT95947.1 putative membrane protein [Verrucomicrobium sp. GAS474]
MQETTPLPINEAKTPPALIVGVLAVSVVAALFLFWLVYFHPPADADGTELVFLPTLNAILNSLAAVALVVGFVKIKAGKIAAHRAAMLSAFVFSSLFLVSYILNHHLHGDAIFQGQGGIRRVYFPILITHILLSVVALPMILITFFLSLTGRFPTHKKLARWTFPVWLYVSVTGVVVVAMLKIYNR